MDLDKIAELFGVQVIETNDLRPGWNGMYLHQVRIILLKKGMDPWKRRSVLAHELGHAYYQDESHGDTRIEKRADQYAARLLISKDAYRAAEEIHGPHLGALAHELGVTPKLVVEWRDYYSRILPIERGS
ncbi:ImmA/IrrE family metallo-endopeptidase [Corynebacterium glutamicum]|uniref:ImmA/IrrE family metallo-endopeptidase n=1 Tax=Corynebacterium glutamicum TaxID=1718 RepID=UPI003C797A5B